MSLLLSGLLCFAVSSVVHQWLSKKPAMNRLASLYSAELQELILWLLSLCLLWLFMGATWFIPEFGHYIGWPWVTSFVNRWDTSAPFASILGAGFHLMWLMVVTLAVYRLGSQLFASALSDNSGRRALSIGAFYGSCVSFDLVRWCFGLERFPQPLPVLASIVGATMFISIVMVTDRRIRARGWRFPLFQVVSSLVSAVLVRRLLETGSIHTTPNFYASAFRDFVGTSTGILTLLSLVILGCIASLDVCPPTFYRELVPRVKALVYARRFVFAWGFRRTKLTRRNRQSLPQLVVVYGSCNGKLFELAGERVTIGRAPTNRIVLAGDPTVSTVHADIRRDRAGRYRISDCRSTNGVFVNGSRVSARMLHHGDEIQLGDNRLKFVVST